MHLPYPSMPPLPTTLQDGLLSALQTAFRYHAEDWLPLRLNGFALGFVNEVWRKHLIQDWPNPLHEDSDGLQSVCGQLDRNGQAVGTGLPAAGMMPAFSAGGATNVLMFGLPTAGKSSLPSNAPPSARSAYIAHAVHINGLAVTEEGLCFWIARRSPHKAVDPNKLDTLVGGGISAGEQIWEAAKREGREEAGLTDAVLNRLQYTGRLHQPCIRYRADCTAECLHISM